MDGGKGKKGGRTLSFWCFKPGVAMAELQQLGVRSIILTRHAPPALNARSLFSSCSSSSCSAFSALILLLFSNAPLLSWFALPFLSVDFLIFL